MQLNVLINPPHSFLQRKAVGFALCAKNLIQTIVMQWSSIRSFVGAWSRQRIAGNPTAVLGQLKGSPLNHPVLAQKAVFHLSPPFVSPKMVSFIRTRVP